MKLIVGLGNPGTKYKDTWHNIGFITVDLMQKKHLTEFPKFKKSAKLAAEVSQEVISKDKIVLAKPQTYMNKSGEAISAIARFYKIKPADVWVIHDDIDLPFGKIRISKNSSSAGHNGIKSVIEGLGTQEFVRFRIGIGPEEDLKIPTDKYVLQKIDKKS